jgi:hypothetical protein
MWVSLPGFRGIAIDKPYPISTVHFPIGPILIDDLKAIKLFFDGCAKLARIPRTNR